MNGAAGERRYGRSSTAATAKVGVRRGPRRARAAPARRGRSDLAPVRSGVPAESKSRRRRRACRRPSTRRALEAARRLPWRSCPRGSTSTPSGTASARARARRRSASRRSAPGRRTGPARPSSRAPARPRSRRAGRGCAAPPARRRGGGRARGDGDRLLDGAAGDLVEDHPLHRHPGREHLGEVPGDRLALAVLVGREVDLARVAHEATELGAPAPASRSETT